LSTDEIETTMNFMPKTTKRTVTFRVTNDKIVDALKRAASADKRSVAVLIEIVMTDWLTARGYLDGEKPKGGAHER
jgi:hypothetical protein